MTIKHTPAKQAAKPVKAGKRKNDSDTGAQGRNNDKKVKAANRGKVNEGKKKQRNKRSIMRCRMRRLS